MQPVVEGVGEELRVARGDGGPEQGSLRGGGGGLVVRQGLGQPAARLQRVDTLIRQHQDRRERQVGGDARRVRAGAVLPDQADAAVERGREVVGVALERQAEPQ